jgi:hypothetical protein
MSFSSWNAKWIYEIAHVGWAAFLVLALAKFTHPFLALIVVVGGSAIKELSIDPLTKSPTPCGNQLNDLDDLAFLTAGAIMGYLVACR